MAEVLLYHHVRGLTDGVRAFAERLREGGHAVHLPDLFEGRTFASIDEGFAHLQEHMGFGGFIDRAAALADGLSHELVYAGFSLGVMPAQRLAQTRAGARGAVFLEACAPATEFGDSWPNKLPVQVHGMQRDPFFALEGDIDAARAIVDTARDGELFVYPGDRHLFTDSSLESYDADQADLVVSRVLTFLDRLT